MTKKEFYSWWKSVRGLLYPIAIAALPIIISQLENLPPDTKQAAWVVPLLVVILKVCRDRFTHPSPTTNGNTADSDSSTESKST